MSFPRKRESIKDGIRERGRMVILTRLIGILITLMGIATLLTPNFLKQMIAYCEQGKRLYWSVGIKLLFGLIFLRSAAQCKEYGVILTLGIFYTAGSIVAFLLGLEKLKSICDWWKKTPRVTIQMWAVVAVGMGVLIVYSA